MTTGKIAVLICVCAATAFAGYGLEWSVTGLDTSSWMSTGNPANNFDVNGDGLPEVLVDNDYGLKIFSGVSRSLIWDLNTYPYMIWYGMQVDGPGLFVTEMDGDGNNELVVCASIEVPPPNGTYCVQVYDCLTHELEFTTPSDSYMIWTVADLDGDGRSEIIICGGGANDRTLFVYGWQSGSVAERSAVPPVVPTGTPCPNPVRHLVRFSVSLAARGRADVIMSNAAGQVVRTIPVIGRPGVKSVTWDCLGNNGKPVPAGNYVYRCGQSEGNVVVVR